MAVSKESRVRVLGSKNSVAKTYPFIKSRPGLSSRSLAKTIGHGHDVFDFLAGKLCPVQNVLSF